MTDSVPILGIAILLPGVAGRAEPHPLVFVLEVSEKPGGCVESGVGEEGEEPVGSRGLVVGGDRGGGDEADVRKVTYVGRKEVLRVAAQAWERREQRDEAACPTEPEDGASEALH